MKRILLTTIMMMVLITVFCVPRLQAEDTVKCGKNSLPIYGKEEGNPALPVLCFEAVNSVQMDAIRGKYEPPATLSTGESVQNRGHIILWDEAKTVCNPYTGHSSGNSESYSILETNRCK